MGEEGSRMGLGGAIGALEPTNSNSEDSLDPSPLTGTPAVTDIAVTEPVTSVTPYSGACHVCHSRQCGLSRLAVTYECQVAVQQTATVVP